MPVTAVTRPPIVRLPAPVRWQHRSLTRLDFELRLSLSWAWALLAAGTALVLALMQQSGTPFVARPPAMRSLLEFALPPICLPLVVPLLATEWEQHTIPQLALRDRLVRVLLWRLLPTAAYLVGVVLAATLASVIRAPQPLSEGGDPRWLAQNLLIALAPTALLAALALLVTHLAVSVVSGYLVPVGFWLANLLACDAPPPFDRARPYLLFSWSCPPAPPRPGWVAGKLLLLAGAALLLAAQSPLLRREARLMRAGGEE
jgi:hypothetical protein